MGRADSGTTTTITTGTAIAERRDFTPLELKPLLLLFGRFIIMITIRTRSIPQIINISL